MIESDEMSGPVELNKTRFAAIALTTGSVLVGIATTVWGLARCAELGGADDASAADFFRTIALWVAGWALGGLLYGIAEILRKLDNLFEALRESGRTPSADTTLYGVPYRAEPAFNPPGNLNAALQELVTLMREVRDISQLSERERAARVRVQGQALVERLQREIPALLREHQWMQAQRRVQQARERYPAFSEWDRLAAQIEVVRASVETRDVEDATRQVKDLAALGAWDRARGLVRELLDRHPDSAAGQELARRLTIQHEKADAETRARLMTQAQEAVNRREWNRALSLTNDTMRRYPNSPEAEALRQQLPTLTENAEIETRQKMENEFRELMKQHRYQEALALARELIERYPKSPQAEVLRDQLPRLEEKVATV